jgi:predicted metal-dependent peptidase
MCQSPSSVTVDTAAAETLIAAATLKLSMDRPYLSSALWAVHRIATTEVPTMAVDAQWRLYFNPETVLSWSTEEVAGVLYHEVCHLLRDHMARAPGEAASDPDAAFRWNLAGDAEINDDLVSEGVALPGSPILPSTLGAPEGRMAEEYYLKIERKHRGKSHGGGGAGCGRCGSCAGGSAEAWERAATVAGLRGLPATESALVRREVALAVKREASARIGATGRGSMPGHWLRWAEAHLAPPKVDWRKELAVAVRRAMAEAAGACDYRYARPSRRQGACPSVIFPSMVRPIPNVAVVVDTSGSVGAKELALAMSEVAGILRAAGQKEGLTVLAVDAAVQACRKVWDARQVADSLKGGGGTDMGVGLAAAARLKPRPDAIVVITDGYTPWPDVPPAGISRTVVVLTTPHGCSPDWARTIVVEPE